MCALRGKGQARARPAPSVLACPHKKANKVLKINAFHTASSDPGRVEDWRVDCRVRWLFRRFRFGPQSGSLITFPVPALRTGRAVFPHLGSPVGSCVSHTGPRSHPWTTPMGLAPVPYSIHVRSRSAARPVDALTTPSSSDDPFTFACDASGVSGPFTGVSGFRHSRDPSPFGHRSSPEAPSLHRHYPASPVLRASPPPCRPSLPLTGSRFGACLTHPQGFPCCCLLPLPCVPASLPRRVQRGARVARFPLRLRPSPFLRWVGPRIARFEACSTFTRVPARMFAEPPSAL